MPNITETNFTFRASFQFPLPEGVYNRAPLPGERGSEDQLRESDMPLVMLQNDESHEYREILRDHGAERIEVTRNNSRTALELRPGTIMDVL